MVQDSSFASRRLSRAYRGRVPALLLALEAASSVSAGVATACLVLAGLVLPIGMALAAPDPIAVPSGVKTAGSCGSIKVPESWTSIEQGAWARLCAGETANLADLDHPSLTKSAGSLPPESHKLSKQFIETILLKEPYKSALPRQGVRISGATFTESIDLSGAHFPWDVWLDESIFERDVDLSEIDATGGVTFDGSQIRGVLSMTDAHIGRYLGMRSGRFNEITLDSAKVDEDLNLGPLFTDGHQAGPRTRVRGHLNMAGIHIGHNLILQSAVLSNVDLSDTARIDGSLQAAELSVSKTLDMDSVDIAHHAILERGVLNELILSGASIGGNLHFERGQSQGTTDMDNLVVKMHVLLADTKIHSLHANFAQVGGDFDLTDVEASDYVVLSNIKIGGHFTACRAHLKSLDLSDANVGGDVDLHPCGDPKNFAQSVLTDSLNMVRITVGRDIVLQGSQLTNVDLGYALVSGSLLADPYVKSIGDKKENLTTSVAGLFLMGGTTVKREIRLDYAQLHTLSLTNVITGSDLTLDDAVVAGPITMDRMLVGGSFFFRGGRNAREKKSQQAAGPANFSFSSVNGIFDISNTVFEGVSLNMLKVGQTLILGTESNADSPAWSNDSFIDLQNASTQSFQDTCTEDSTDRCLSRWPPLLALNGFSYAHPGNSVEMSRQDVALRPADWWLKWLGKQTPYSPAPYEQAATTQRALGRPDVAEAIEYASRQRELGEAWASLVQAARDLNLDAGLAALRHAVWLALLRAAVGYGIGYRTLVHSVFWVVIWVTLGVIVLRRYGENNQNGLPNFPIAYSFDMLLPVIKLREDHYKIDLKSGARIYFYYHKILGYVLASFLIAGLSGIISR